MCFHHVIDSGIPPCPGVPLLPQFPGSVGLVCPIPAQTPLGAPCSTEPVADPSPDASASSPHPYISLPHCSLGAWGAFPAAAPLAGTEDADNLHPTKSRPPQWPEPPVSAPGEPGQPAAWAAHTPTQPEPREHRPVHLPPPAVAVRLRAGSGGAAWASQVICHSSRPRDPPRLGSPCQRRRWEVMRSKLRLQETRSPRKELDQVG